MSEHKIYVVRGQCAWGKGATIGEAMANYQSIPRSVAELEVQTLPLGTHPYCDDMGTLRWTVPEGRSIQPQDVTVTAEEISRACRDEAGIALLRARRLIERAIGVLGDEDVEPAEHPAVKSIDALLASDFFDPE